MQLPVTNLSKDYLITYNILLSAYLTLYFSMLIFLYQAKFVLLAIKNYYMESLVQYDKYFLCVSYGTNYPRMNQVQFVEDSL